MGTTYITAACLLIFTVPGTSSPKDEKIKHPNSKLPAHHILFPPVQNATLRALRQRTPHEAMYAHGHDSNRRAISRNIDDEDYACFRSPVIASLNRGQVLIALVEGRRISCHEHGGPHHILMRISNDGGETWEGEGEGEGVGETGWGGEGHRGLHSRHILISSNTSSHFKDHDSFRNPTPVVYRAPAAGGGGEGDGVDGRRTGRVRWWQERKR